MEDLFLMVFHAWQSVPFYMDLYQEYQSVIEEKRFLELPIINKERYVSGGKSGLSVAYMKEYLQEKLIWTRTSGTSGRFSEVYWHPKEMRRSLLSLWLLRKKYYGISARNRMCYFYQAGEGDALFFEQGNSLAVARTCLYGVRLQEVYSKILSYNPEWMICQPSIALVLCDCAEKFGKPSALRYIEFTGEYLEPSVRRKTEQIFQCQTANQYGTKEVNSIAFECPCGRMHVMSDNVYAEVIPHSWKQDIHYICVTSLQNFAMPLIRYQLEDRGEIHRDVSCPCGVFGNVIELYGGRSNDMVMMQNGSFRHPYMLTDIFQIVNFQAEGAILQYQIEQGSIGEFVVRLVLEEDEWQKEIEEELCRLFYDRLGYEVKIVFEYYEKVLPAVNSNKPVVFRSKITGDK